jgi:hypothetical protein
MVYIYRHLEITIKKIEKIFSTVLITGPRQVGKTTILKKLKNKLQYITLDDPIILQTAINEPGNFFKSINNAIIDEIQYAPDLFKYIKMIVDNNNKKGQFYLTGSQQFHLMKNVSETLAGRIGILNLLGLSLREINNIKFNLSFIPTEVYFKKRQKKLKPFSYKQIWNIIWKGSMPAMYAQKNDWNLYYSTYLKTYLERDVRDLTQVGDELKFLQFMRAIAANTGNLLNLASISKEVGISQPTAQRWLSVLQTSNIVYLLYPYSNNIIKRAIKTPKIYFLDTGLCAFLTKWNNQDVLENGAMAGAFFETFVISEIIKSYYNVGLEPPIYFYRDRDGKEIDLLIVENGSVYPIEIKKTSNPNTTDIQTFSVINSLKDLQRKEGGIICMYDNLIPLKNNDMIIPINYL